MEAMGADDRLPADALIARLIARPHGFDLFQAIHLLERAQPWARALGHGDGSDEAVRLKGSVSLSFEASDVRRIERHALEPAGEGRDAAAHDAAARHAQAPRETYTLTQPVMTLAGAGGPLPMPFTEMVLQRRAARETAMADLLDIFNHRFLSFLYRSRQKIALGLRSRNAERDAGRGAVGATDIALAACLDALGDLGLQAAPSGPGGARLWLRHAGLLGGAPRSMMGLLALLSDRLGVKVRGAQFVGGWRSVDAADSARVASARTRASGGAKGATDAGAANRWSASGYARGTSVSRAASGPAVAGASHDPRTSFGSALGGLAVLGRRVWDQAAGVRIEFVELSDATFAALLPDGRAHALAAWLVRSYLQQDHDVFFVLHRQRAGGGCALGGKAAARLGWTSWLGGASANRNAGANAGTNSGTNTGANTGANPTDGGAANRSVTPAAATLASRLSPTPVTLKMRAVTAVNT